MTPDTDDLFDPGGYYGFSGFAQPGANIANTSDPGPKPRDRQHELATQSAVQQHVKRCGPINDPQPQSLTQTALEGSP